MTVVTPTPEAEHRRTVRRTVATVAGLNFAAFWVEAAVALAIGSVSLLADSVDFVEDTAINLLIVVALGWTARRQAVAGQVMAGLILLPALAAVWQAVVKARDPYPPSVEPLVATAAFALVVNALCAWLLVAKVRRHGGSLGKAAYLSARNDVAVNAAIIAMGLVTAWTGSGWPDLVLGAVIVLVNGTAAHEVWETAREEHLAAKALAGDDID